MAEAEERAEDDPDDAALRAEVERLAARGAAAEAEVAAARERRVAIEAGMDRHEVMRVHRQRGAGGVTR